MRSSTRLQEKCHVLLGESLAVFGQIRTVSSLCRTLSYKSHEEAHKAQSIFALNCPCFSGGR